MAAQGDEHLSKRSDALTAAVVFSHVVFTYAPVYLAAAGKPGLALVGFWIWFGFCQNGLINLMHECAHKLTFRSSAANELLGTFVLAPLVIADFAGYRERHWRHHRHLGTTTDPKVVYQTDVRGAQLLKLALRSLGGIEAMRRLTERPAESSDDAGAKHGGVSLPLVVTQTVFLSSVFATAFLTHDSAFAAVLAGAVAYGFVYLYGLGSLTVFAAALRAIAEHQIGGDASATEENAALRNLRCNLVTRLIFGAYGFGEHATHHARPNVPYYRLPALTEDLARTDSAMVAKRGYLGTIAGLATQAAGDKGSAAG